MRALAAVALPAAEAEVGHVRGEVALLRCMVSAKQLSLLAELRAVYPIVEVSRGSAYTIRGLLLPDKDYATLPVRPLPPPSLPHCALHLATSHWRWHPSPMSRSPPQDEQVSTALGYTCHCVMLVGKYLGVPLRYTPHFVGSRSVMKDEVLAGGSWEQPLYFKGVDQYAFLAAVRMLQRDVEQLCYWQGLSVLPDAHMLANLMRLFHVLLNAALPVAEHTAPTLPVAAAGQAPPSGPTTGAANATRRPSVKRI